MVGLAADISLWDYLHVTNGIPTMAWSLWGPWGHAQRPVRQAMLHVTGDQQQQDEKCDTEHALESSVCLLSAPNSGVSGFPREKEVTAVAAAAVTLTAVTPLMPRNEWRRGAHFYLDCMQAIFLLLADNARGQMGLHSIRRLK